MPNPTNVTLRVQLVLPIRSDPNYSTKTQVWRTLGNDLGIQVISPPENPSVTQFESTTAIKSLSKMDAVFADLSFERPSCYYELGLAQALGLNTTVVIDRTSQLHQLSFSTPVYRFGDLEEYTELASSLMTQLVTERLPEADPSSLTT